MDDRPLRHDIHMATATLWAQRSLCKRMKVGCVITSSDMRQILSIGYNGPAKGLPNDRCRGTEGSCGCLHAEDNAIAMVDGTIPDKVLFTTMAPCEMCAQRIVQARIIRVFYRGEYRCKDGALVLEQVGVNMQSLTAT